jgi:hypothetical protein
MSLDDGLAAWAATVRLPDAEVAAIFQRTVGPSGRRRLPHGRSGRSATRPRLLAALHGRFHRASGLEHPPGTTGSLMVSVMVTGRRDAGW